MKHNGSSHHRRTRTIIKETTFGAEVIHSLRDFFATIERGEQVTISDVKLDLQPGRYAPRAVRATRLKLGVSQSVFAELLGVKTKTVQAWEQGSRPPAGAARRLLDQINQDPQRWLASLRQTLTRKAG
jgi:putative transcriptional regulator